MPVRLPRPVGRCIGLGEERQMSWLSKAVQQGAGAVQDGWDGVEGAWEDTQGAAEHAANEAKKKLEEAGATIVLE